MSNKKLVALVTGGTRGIGEGISCKLLESNYTVIANYANNDEKAKQFTAKTSISAVKWDVSSFEACQENVQKITKDYGPISILVNNAGITRDKTLHQMSLEKWEAVISTNLDSCFNMCRSVIESMREQKYGRIINISSVNAQTGQFGQANYAAAKAGIIGLSKTLAVENARSKITVNVIAPGYIATEMLKDVPEDILQKIIARIPVGRLGTPEDIARCVAFLASEDATFITGSTLSANGGMYMD